MLVYRNGSRVLPSQVIVRELLEAVQCDTSASARADEALLRAGELECALADLHDPAHALSQHLSDALAARRLGCDSPRLPQLLVALEGAALPDRLRLKTPEGFAYYALSPLAYAALTRELPALRPPVAVIGVRSIGTTLSAMVCEALRARQLTAARISVRPGGHPWDRTLDWSVRERAFVETHARAGGDFLIVDEGPGMSGSTFLAVAAALERAAVPAERIRLLCSHLPDVSRLVAPGASERWSRYRSHAPAPLCAPAGSVDVSGGTWRRHFIGEGAPDTWPACWTQLERIKWWQPEARVLDKFEGLPPYGNAPLARAQALADAGFAPGVRALPGGFARYELSAGRPARAGDLGADTLSQIARYCAARSGMFAAADSDVHALSEMVRVNVEELFGCVPALPALELHTPVVCDARMMPYEWRYTADGQLIKTDGHGHGDDHLLPGPTDVCWDLAGAIVEWNMREAAADALLGAYVELTGDRDATRRLPGYLVAYCALRCGQLQFAAHSGDAAEQVRLAAAQRNVEHRLARLLRVSRRAELRDDASAATLGK